MAISFDRALGIHDDALRFRSQRASVLANNLANMDTPNYKARDMDFASALEQASQASDSIAMKATHAAHHRGTGLIEGQGDVMYRVPAQPSIDGNTVEEHVEHAKYMENSLAFQATFTFLNSKFKGLTNAIRGE
ncbi:flagellar basal body rod protein FlgB [Pseudomaricurvus alkylphenolicus]|uniref:flagellar basal body rod protein FlgB n=1 Tax=Pseudomaricurvus alkylphenolicus TaxID=1306991 RepID=UPI0014201D95|nr:flagellar basal body rod protein FlgB [Pseudomaricurvus alkylphenolicus]NIB43260.1 flagellar basal body rod protein FlgB [Pseudomaricurvus alkylphenolicus]